MAKAPSGVKMQKKYKRDFDAILGYARGTILFDDEQEFRSVRAAEDVVLHRYCEYGMEGVHNLMALVDDCRIPSFFEGPAYEERFLSTKLMEERLNQLSRKHLGGDYSYRAMAFNRLTAGVTGLILALVPPGSMVPYIVPPYPGLALRGHPCVPRGVALAGSEHKVMSSTEELEEILDEEVDVPLVAICGSYRGIIKDDLMSGVCRIAHARGIPVFVDDASGARNRVISFGQSKAADLGVDLVITSCDKAGLLGPRAGILLGRDDLMTKIGARTVYAGAEARPSTIASIIRCLEEFDPEKAKEMYDHWRARHQCIWEMLKPVFGDELVFDAYGGVLMGLEAFAEIVMDKASLDELDLAPADISTAHAMFMLRRHGFMTITPLHYPGATKIMSVKVNTLKSPGLSDEDIAEGVLDSLDQTAKIVDDRSAMEEVLFGPPSRPFAEEEAEL